MWHLLRGGGSLRRVLVGKSEGKKLLGKPRHIWECNIKIGFTITCHEEVEWIDLAQNRYKWQVLVNATIVLNIYYFLTD
jgi:hypothetical protein